MSIKNWQEFIKDIPTDVLETELKRRKDEINVDPIAKNIMDKTDEALDRFGKYTFEDKGPWEVMDVTTLTNQLKDKTAKDAASILSQVLDNYSNQRYAASIVECIIGQLDSMPNDWFDELLSLDQRFEY